LPDQFKHAGSVFSPDGTKLFYLVRRGSARSDEYGELWAAELKTGRTERILADFVVTGFDISSDGKRILFAALDGEGKSYLLDGKLRPALSTQASWIRPPNRVLDHFHDFGAFQVFPRLNAGRAARVEFTPGPTYPHMRLCGATSRAIFIGFYYREQSDPTEHLDGYHSQIWKDRPRSIRTRPVGSDIWSAHVEGQIRRPSQCTMRPTRKLVRLRGRYTGYCKVRVVQRVQCRVYLIVGGRELVAAFIYV
jgi:WD40-like Beta Propeller Repeat